jgi:hypothetical protein
MLDDAPAGLIVESLGEGEVIYYKGKSQRLVPGGKLLNPTELYVTNQRLIYYQPAFFGRGDLTDLHYADVQAARFHKGLISIFLLLSYLL